MYAFYTTGSIEGVSQKMLRGEQPAASPLDCSVESWKQRWRENANQLAPFVQGKSMNKNQWTKILSIDPNWVRRRPAKGWIKPKNYFEGCLMTAAVAIRSMTTDPASGADAKDGVTPDILAAVNRRLQQQLEIISTGRSSGGVERSNILGQMTCMEGALTMQELDICRTSADIPVKSLLDEKYALSLLRVVTLQQGIVESKLTSQIPGALSKISGEDLMSRLDITPEYRLLGYLANGGAIEQSLSKVEQEFSEIKFR
jgi:hypothetical protein